MLSETKGVNMHATTVAKIESGDRAVRINEAVAIADLLDVSLDSIIGRHIDSDNEFRYTFRNLTEGAEDSLSVLQEHQRGTMNRLHAVLEFPFLESKSVAALGRSAADAISTAMDELFALAQLRVPVRTEEEKAFWGDAGAKMQLPKGSIGNVLASAEQRGMTPAEALAEAFEQGSEPTVFVDADDAGLIVELTGLVRKNDKKGDEPEA